MIPGKISALRSFANEVLRRSAVLELCGIDPEKEPQGPPSELIPEWPAAS